MSNVQNLTSDWHLDKRVPIIVIFTILMQSIALIWYMSKQDSRLTSLELTTIRLEREIKNNDITVNTNRLNIAVVNQSLNDIKESLRRIEKNVDGINQKQLETT